MTKILTAFLFVFCLCNHTFTQVEGHEIGFDGFFGASTIGGSFGIGAKYGVKFNEHFIAGPSVRFQRSWFNNLGMKGGFNIYGGGGFFHARLYDALFLGTEIEFLKSPFSWSNIYTGSQWVPTVLIGGGFSKEFNETWRLNAGVMYDVVNHPNSPLRQGYMLRRTNGSYIPIIYRVAFFFPI